MLSLCLDVSQGGIYQHCYTQRLVILHCTDLLMNSITNQKPDQFYFSGHNPQNHQKLASVGIFMPAKLHSSWAACWFICQTFCISLQNSILDNYSLSNLYFWIWLCGEICYHYSSVACIMKLSLFSTLYYFDGVPVTQWWVTVEICNKRNWQSSLVSFQSCNIRCRKSDSTFGW